eukprot:NODE_705_length_1967_cov_46.187696_g652_i0.p1 GENE.NODE_705_length_1967_cov_46.187696_g652_i0~~NODE_705_length_1967_cov_46.187696_g652_i0.p1  ORF type:complete len:632 (-),score=57.52 NODE_705_length_1967_cov_46.187696_g652_i0:11-1906(-)
MIFLTWVRVVALLLLTVGQLVVLVAKYQLSEAASQLQIPFVAAGAFLVTLSSFTLFRDPRGRVCTAALPLVMGFATAAVSYTTTPQSSHNLSDQIVDVVYVLFLCGMVSVAILAYGLVQLGRSRTAIASMSLVLAGTYVRGLASRSEWTRGLLGEQMVPGSAFPFCPVPADMIVWPSLLIPRAANFFVGPYTCGSPQTFAHLDRQRRVLHVNCPDTTPDIVFGGGSYNHSSGLYRFKNKNASRHVQLAEGRTSTPMIREWAEVRCGSRKIFCVMHIPKAELLSRDPQGEPTSEPPRLNVMVIMLDAVSRLQFRRRMPELVQILEELHRSGRSSLFQFFRYTTVGHSTMGNIPLMVGGKFNHISYTAEDKRFLAERYWWSEFKRHRYATVYQSNLCEDELGSWMSGEGLLDHHFVEWACQPEYDAYGERSNIVGPYSVRQRCLAGDFVHAYQLQHLQEAWSTYRRLGVRVASHSVFEEGHEGTLEVVSTLDSPLAELVKHFKIEGHLNDTVIVFTSDHGLHMGPYWMTRPGRLEHKLPLLVMLFPRWFTQQHPETERALRHNAQSLVTAWDIYATLRHVASFPAGWNRGNATFPAGPPWACTLFDRIPYNRTCREARIPARRCICGVEWDKH